MAVTINGTIKYARHMQGKSAKGEDYSFFSFVVLDNDEGVKWPLQIQHDHPQFGQLAPRAAELMDASVEVVIRSFSAGYRKVKHENGPETKEPQARFFAKSVTVKAAPNMNQKATAGASR